MQSFYNAILRYLRNIVNPLIGIFGLLKTVPWIVNGLIFIVGWNLVISYFEPLFNGFVNFFGYFLTWIVPNFSTEDYRTTIVQIFQTVASWNSFLPISETFVVLGLLLTYFIARIVVTAILWLTRRFFDIIP